MCKLLQLMASKGFLGVLLLLAFASSGQQVVFAQHNSGDTDLQCIPLSEAGYAGIGDAAGFKVDKYGNVFALMKGQHPNCGISWLPYGAIEKIQTFQSGSRGYWKSSWDEICLYQFNVVERVEDNKTYAKTSSAVRKIACAKKKWLK